MTHKVDICQLSVFQNQCSGGNTSNFFLQQSYGVVQYESRDLKSKKLHCRSLQMENLVGI